MVSKLFGIPDTQGIDTKIKSLHNVEPKLLLEVVHDLLNVVHPFCALQDDVRLLKIISNDFPYLKTHV